MSESILYIIIFIAASVIGVLLGMYISSLKNKAQLSGLEERDSQLQNAINGLEENIEKTAKGDIESNGESEFAQTARYFTGGARRLNYYKTKSAFLELESRNTNTIIVKPWTVGS